MFKFSIDLKAIGPLVLIGLSDPSFGTHVITTYGITNVKASCFGYESEKVPDPNVEDFLFSAYYGL